MAVIIECGGMELDTKEMSKGGVNTLVSHCGLSTMLETLHYFTNKEINRPKVYIVHIDWIVMRQSQGKHSTHLDWIAHLVQVCRR